MLLAEHVNIRAVSLAFVATILSRVFYLKWTGVRVSKITGKSGPQGIPVVMHLFVATLFLAVVWCMTPFVWWVTP
jgi:hypothetical protein